MVARKKKGPPIQTIPQLVNPSELATAVEYLATDAVQEWLRLERAGEHRVPMTVPLSATVAAIVPEQFAKDIAAALDPATHHDWLALARAVDTEWHARSGVRWKSWRPLLPRAAVYNVYTYRGI